MLIALAAIAFFASFAIAMSGFGFALVSMAGFPNFMTVLESSAVATVLGLLVIIVNLIPLRRQIRFRLLVPVLISAVASLPVGIFFLVRLNEQVLRIGLGVVILLTLLATWLSRKQTIRKPSTWIGVAAGVVSGAFGGAYSVSGPPVALYLAGVIEDKRELKASLLFYFAIIVGMRVPFLAFAGVFTPALLRTCLVLLAPLAVGLVAGTFAFGRLSSAVVRLVLQILLAVSAVLLILRAL